MLRSAADACSYAEICAQVNVHAGSLPCAGFLYPPGDYAEAARITAELLESPEQRQAVGAAARLEVERWGWLPATQQLREQQYQRAIRRNRGRRW